MNVEEFKAILKIVLTDNLTAIRVCNAVEKFREKHPRVYGRVMEDFLWPRKRKSRLT
ncbi:MAG: hypothetical protein IBV52_07965 [Candidatus Bathyarchaeota archaeon]